MLRDRSVLPCRVRIVAAALIFFAGGRRAGEARAAREIGKLIEEVDRVRRENLARAFRQAGL
jgi:hypothetical protein